MEQKAHLYFQFLTLDNQGGTILRPIHSWFITSIPFRVIKYKEMKFWFLSWSSSLLSQIAPQWLDHIHLFNSIIEKRFRFLSGHQPPNTVHEAFILSKKAYFFQIFKVNIPHLKREKNKTTDNHNIRDRVPLWNLIFCWSWPNMK